MRDYLKYVLLVFGIATIGAIGYYATKKQHAPITRTDLTCKAKDPAKDLNIVIYSTDSCPYCVKAKELLKTKGLNYTEINVSYSETLVHEMKTRTKGKTGVPQIFFNGKYVGDYGELARLADSGELDKIAKSCK